MAHDSNIVRCDGPDAPHAFDVIPLCPRNGMLDALCPKCRGYGQWNVEIDLVSFRSTRAICDRCFGEGWVETGSDPVALPDIDLSAQGSPEWVTRYVPQADAAPEDIAPDPLIKP